MKRDEGTDRQTSKQKDRQTSNQIDATNVQTSKQIARQTKNQSERRLSRQTNKYADIAQTKINKHK